MIRVKPDNAVGTSPVQFSVRVGGYGSQLELLVDGSFPEIITLEGVFLGQVTSQTAVRAYPEPAG